MLPSVSVVIPTYNYGHFVCEAVESALGQTYPAVEVIVVDDGSTDDTRQRLAAYGGRIRYIHQANAGLSAARNTGIRAASGDLIALLDSDDAFHPQKLELQVRTLHSRPDIALLGTDSFSDSYPFWVQLTCQPAIERISLETIVMKARFAPSSVLVRKQVFHQVGLFDETLRSVEDKDMWIRIALAFRMAKLKAPLCWYRVQSGSMSHNPGRMELFDRLVLQRAFSNPILRNRRRIRHLAFSHAALSAAYAYHIAGNHRPALKNILKSWLSWPLPYSLADARFPLVRLRLLLSILLKGIGFSSSR